MKKTFKLLLILCMVATLFLSASISANADGEHIDGNTMRADVNPMWCNLTVSVPGGNGYTFGNVWVYKGTTETRGSFVCLDKDETRNYDARIVNSYYEPRSSWARNLDVNSVINVSLNGAAKGYQYTCEVSSDLLDFGVSTVALAFSPDFFKNYP